MFLISLEKSVYQYYVNICQTQVKRETICGTTYPSLHKDEIESPFVELKLTGSLSFVFIISSGILTYPLFSIHFLTFNWFICRFILYITKYFLFLVVYGIFPSSSIDTILFKIFKLYFNWLTFQHNGSDVCVVEILNHHKSLFNLFFFFHVLYIILLQ